MLSSAGQPERRTCLLDFLGSRLNVKAALCRWALNGPLWTGLLHDAAMVEQMQAEAAELGWTGPSVPGGLLSS